MNTVSIADGKHLFSGIQRYSSPSMWEDQGVNGIMFVIDGKTYIAGEDPADGYRSYGVLQESDKVCKNTFEPQDVFVKTEYGHTGDTNYWKMFVTDAHTKQLIFMVGTDDYDSWYPCAIFEYHPENMFINQGR